MATTKPGRKRRRIGMILALAVIVVVAAAAAVPTVLGTAAARRWLLTRANQALAPARLEFATIRFSWFRPTRLTSFTIRDAEGEPVVTAPTAAWDRNLRQILFDRPRYGTLNLQHAVLDVERRADGTIDLLEALRPVLGKNPRTDLHIRLPDARLRLRIAGQSVPVTADRADLALDAPASPQPLAWNLTLEKSDAARPASLAVSGRFERWKTPKTLTLDLNAQRWPWAVSAADHESAGRLDGRFTLQGRAGAWTTSGEADLLELDVAGPSLAGDHLRLDRVDSSWNIAAGAEDWIVHQLDLTAPLGTLKAHGRPMSAQADALVEGTIDLAALARQLPHALRLRQGVTLDQGSAKFRVESNARHDEPNQAAGAPANGREPRRWNFEAKITDLQARDQDQDRRFTLHEPATLAGRLTHDRTFTLEQLELTSAFLNVTGQGDVDRGVDWSGTIDLGGLQRQLRDLLDFGAVELAGDGRISGRYRRTQTTFEGSLTSELRNLKVAGLTPDPLQRDLVRLDAVLDGQAHPSGLPSSWNNARFDLNTGGATIQLSSKPDADPSRRNLSLTAESPLPGLDPARRARGRLDAQWGPAGVAVDRLALSLLAKTGERDEERILLDAKGRYDRQAGLVELTPSNPPSPDAAPAEAVAVTLAPEGIQISGLGGTGPLRVSAGFTGDLGALRRLLAFEPDPTTSTDGLLSGPWSARTTLDSDEDGLRFATKLDLHPVTTSGSPPEAGGNAETLIETELGPTTRDAGLITLSLNALRAPGAHQLELTEIGLASRYLSIEGSGRLHTPSQTKNPENPESKPTSILDLSGMVTPHWDAINKLLASRIEPGARVTGKPRAWRISGPLSGRSAAEILGALDAEVGLELVEANIYGLHLGTLPIVLRSRDGRLELDTMDAPLNGGRLHLEPRLALDDEAGPSLRLDEKSSITNAEINDEVSRRFLSYVAPVIDRATRAHGRVSVGLQEAEFPLGGAEPREAKVEGKVVFQDVEFLPGPLINEIYGILGRTDRPSIKLNEPVALTIADRRVYQQGLTIPLGPTARVELNGWVDFDRNIHLDASLPITAAMVGDAPVLSALVENQRIDVPIRGSLKTPVIDRDAMKLSLTKLGESVLGAGVVRGAAELFQRLQRPRDPNAPAPPTMQERRAERQERRAERRRQRGLQP